MDSQVYKTIQITGESAVSSDDAVKIAVERASKTVHNLKWFKVTETRGYIKDGKIAGWQVSVDLGFALEGTEIRSADHRGLGRNHHRWRGGHGHPPLVGPNLPVTGPPATILGLVALRREGQSVGAWSFLKLGGAVMPLALIAALASFIGLKF